MYIIYRHMVEIYVALWNTHVNKERLISPMNKNRAGGATDNRMNFKYPSMVRWWSGIVRKSKKCQEVTEKEYDRVRKLNAWKPAGKYFEYLSRTYSKCLEIKQKGWN